MIADMDVVITVPHGHPSDDHNAPEIAERLHGILQSAGYGSSLFVNRESRFEAPDCNRAESRKSRFRQQVTEALGRRPRMLVDVHSFPHDVPGFWPESIVLLHTPGVQSLESLVEYSNTVWRGAKRLGVDMKVGIHPARYADDINIEARQVGHPADALMLVEHSYEAPVTTCAALHALAIVSTFKRRGWR